MGKEVQYKRLRGSPTLVLKGKAKGGRILFRLDPELHKELALRAKQQNINLNQLILNAVREYISDQDNSNIS